MEGTTIDGKYQVFRLLGRGGMGAVYEAVHVGTGRRVALKSIVPEAVGEGEYVARFRREARTSGTIDSQHVVQVLDTGVDPSTKTPYLVMELLRGEDLSATLELRGPLPWELAVRIVAQACSGLVRAHAEGIIHRDIKAANVYLALREETDVVVKLLDFGIAKLRPDHLAAASVDPSTDAALGTAARRDRVGLRVHVDSRRASFSTACRGGDRGAPHPRRLRHDVAARASDASGPGVASCRPRARAASAPRRDRLAGSATGQRSGLRGRRASTPRSADRERGAGRAPEAEGQRQAAEATELRSELHHR